ncbi:hypothetical protein, partial [Tahibacter caeni]|uniref:hypothetical protein n=1 Tax=Tahibacter caeni TaxID=1453545 RepID=UPI003CCDD516
MRRVLCSLFAALALAGCASTGYYREDGAADYYYERDAYYGGGYYAGYGVGPGYVGFYDPFWAPGFYLGVSSWPYYGYGSYYAGWPYFGYAPWYDSWWGVGYNDWSWHRHQQALARDRNAGSEAAAIAGLRGRGAPDRDGTAGLNPGAARLAPDGAANRRGLPDTSRQFGTERVDPYYGTPRIRRGEGLPQREAPQLGTRGAPQRSLPAREAPGLPARGDRPFRSGPAVNESR